ncbi:hypothetical protein QYF50_06410 [Paenibacillus vini]|uniref:hypothetical protein n=1 Tax=Paenibacillus vini TaxID=1476024 RepID=UPI0025B67282|nr:hypothetical protein [Paenibacillus vini]MDN4067523.1 hypothetical protein [Paenibacillus vini]
MANRAECDQCGSTNRVKYSIPYDKESAKYCAACEKDLIEAGEEYCGDDNDD